MRNTRLLLVLTLAIVSGLIAGYSAIRYLRDRPPEVLVADQPRETLPVVVAARDVPLGQTLTEEDVTTIEWPAGSMPLGVASSPEEVIGRSLIRDVYTNEVILASKLADSGLRGMIPLIPPGMRALSVRVDEVIGVAGFVTPQTRVDVILIMTPPEGREPLSKVILQNIEAIAAGQQIQETAEGEAIMVTVVTVLVTPEQAERLALAANEGRIQMALRNTLDLEATETDGERVSGLFEGMAGRPRAGVRAAAGSSSAAESIIEVYQGGVRTLISY